MKKFFICFLALSGFSFAEMIEEPTIQKNDASLVPDSEFSNKTNEKVIENTKDECNTCPIQPPCNEPSPSCESPCPPSPINEEPQPIIILENEIPSVNPTASDKPASDIETSIAPPSNESQSFVNETPSSTQDSDVEAHPYEKNESVPAINTEPLPCNKTDPCKPQPCHVSEPCQTPEPCSCQSPCCQKKYFSIAAKAAYFRPDGDVYHDLYEGGFSPMLEFTFPLPRWFNIFAEGAYFHKNHHITSADLTVKSDVTSIPVSLGMNVTWCVTSFLDIYIKGGPNWIYTKTWVDIPGLKHVVKRNTFGVTIGGGFKVYVAHCTYLECFVNYMYDRREIHDRDASDTFHRQLGGIQTGVGLGFKF